MSEQHETDDVNESREAGQSAPASDDRVRRVYRSMNEAMTEAAAVTPPLPLPPDIRR